MEAEAVDPGPIEGATLPGGLLSGESTISLTSTFVDIRRASEAGVTCVRENIGRDLVPDSEPIGNRLDANRAEGEGCPSCKLNESISDVVLKFTRLTSPSNDRIPNESSASSLFIIAEKSTTAVRWKWFSKASMSSAE